MGLKSNQLCWLFETQHKHTGRILTTEPKLNTTTTPQCLNGVYRVKVRLASRPPAAVTSSFQVHFL